MMDNCSNMDEEPDNVRASDAAAVEEEDA